MNMKKKNDSSTLAHTSHKHVGYMASVVAIVVVVFVLLNLIVGQLPSHVREFDLTNNALYEVSDTSIEFLSTLDKDIEITVMAEDSLIDPRVTKFLDSYVSYSSHLSLDKIDPVAHPIALTEYNAESSSIVVRCEETGKQRNIPFSDVIVTDWYAYLYQGGASESAFDADGQLTSAVNYVTRDYDVVVYTVSNHNEAEIPESATASLNKANLDIQPVNLLLDGGIPENCAELIFYQPTSDLADAEVEMLETYLDNGGSIYYVAGNQADTLPNFTKLLRDYGMEIVPGYIADTGRYFQQYGSAYAIWATPVTLNSVATDFDNNDLFLVLYSRGMQKVDPIRDTITVSAFLETSEKGVAVTNDGETPGTYMLGAVAYDSESKGHLTVLSAYSLVDENIITSFPNASNLDLFVSAATTQIDSESISIPAKNLEVTYNSVANPMPATVIFVGVLPLVFLIAGLYMWLKRRKL